MLIICLGHINTGSVKKVQKQNLSKAWNEDDVFEEQMLFIVTLRIQTLITDRH